jgi:pyruvate dehydrogenase E2 component (dihydrolipoamide acetyltransferase)
MNSFIKIPIKMLRLASTLTRVFSKYPSHELLKMPLLSPTMQSGTLVKWLKQEGDVIKPGELMFEVETDKATLGYEV